MLRERRTHRRDDLMEVVRYALSPSDSDSVLRGLIKDYSNSGLCLITDQAPEKGQEMIINSIIMPYSKRAIVRWYQDLGEAAYKSA